MADKRIVILLLGVYIVALIFRIDFLLRSEQNQTLANYFGEKSTVVGAVKNDPEHRETSTHVHVEVSAVNGEGVQGKVLVILPREIDLKYGDTIEVSGAISEPLSFETETGRTFDYPNYLRVKGISAIMRYATLERSSEGSISLQRSLYDIKHSFENSVEKIFTEPSASLLEGILLGERRGLPQELTDAFIVAGLIHIVVLSGYNMGIVSEAVLRSTSFLPASLSYSVSAVFMVLFAIMSGAGATTVRACVMGLIAILARYLKRPQAALRALIVAALSMTLWNPLILLYDPSFILSVLATFGLITLSPTVEKYLTFIPEKFGVRSIAATTIAVQIFVLPALLYMSGILSFLSVPANIIALPFVPLTMIFGFFAGLLGLLHPALALPFVLLTDLLLNVVMIVAETARALPYAYTTIPAFSLWIVTFAYIPLVFIAFKLFQGAELHKKVTKK